MKEEGKDLARESQKERAIHIEKEIEKSLFWGAMGCETGPFSLI